MMKKCPKKSRQSIEEVPKKQKDKKEKITPIKGGAWTKKTKITSRLDDK